MLDTTVQSIFPYIIRSVSKPLLKQVVQMMETSYMTQGSVLRLNTDDILGKRLTVVNVVSFLYRMLSFVKKVLSVGGNIACNNLT